MPPRKRKAPAKYEIESPVKRVKSTSNTPTKRTPTKRTSTPRAAKVNRNDPEWLVTNESSPLAHEDLHAELCDPKTYEGFTPSDWSDLAATLPDDVPRNNDGSIPIDFFKYNSDFRRGIREFQEDLASGRLEPAWQASAAQAMEDRAHGKFDAYKEKQFEEFWGQKQKLDYTALAGESAKLKLDVLVQNGVFKEGDIFSYNRVVSKAGNKTLFEKDCKIVNIGLNTLTLAIPPDQLKFARLVAEPEIRASVETEKSRPAGTENERSAPSLDTNAEPNHTPAGNDTAKSERAIDEAEIVVDGASPLKRAQLGDEAELPMAKIQYKDTATDPEDEQSPGSMPGGSATQESVIYHELKSLQQLEQTIFKIDGRLKGTEIRTVNAWRCIRCKRNNQDLGSLFEMREDFYVYKYPQINKGSRDARMKARNGDD